MLDPGHESAPTSGELDGARGEQPGANRHGKSSTVLSYSAAAAPAAPYARHIPEAWELPPELVELRIWLPWTLIQRQGKAKPDKVPISPEHGSPCRWTAPGSTTGFEVAALAAAHNPQAQGVGIVLTPDCGLAGIDLDHCRDPSTGRLSDEARAILEAADTYAEVSPGLAGIRALAFGSFGGHVGIDHARGIELYESGRFLTITGDHIESTPFAIERRDLSDLGRRYFPDRADPAAPPHGPAKAPADFARVDLSALPLSPTTRRLIETGDASAFGDDRSIALFGAAKDLMRAGLSDYDACRVLVDPSHGISAAALERRAGDVASAMQWVMRYTIPKARREVESEPRADFAAMLAQAAPEAPGVEVEPTEPAALTRDESERLCAWLWRTGRTLPDWPKAPRVSVVEGTRYTAPWPGIAASCAPGEFAAKVAEYLPRRAELVDAKNLERMNRGQQPQPDVDPETLTAHATAWAARIGALEVPDAEGRALLARAQPGPDGKAIAAPLHVNPVPEDATADLAPPAELFDLTGALGSLFRHYMACARYPQPWQGVACAIATCATVMGRSYAHDGTFPNLLAILVGKTGSGKDLPQAVAYEALSKAGLTARIGPGAISSGAAIEDHHATSPVALWVIDEMGKMLASVAESDSGRMADIAGKLMRLYSASGRTYIGRALASVQGAPPIPKTIAHPCLVLLGASTHDAMGKALTAGDLESGLIGRLLFFVSTEGRPFRADPTARTGDIPAEFLDWARIAGVEHGPGNLPTGAIVVPDALDVAATTEAAQVLRGFSDATDDRLRATHDATAYAGLVRAAETSVKLALIAAVSDDPETPRIEPRHARWGCDAAAYLARAFSRTFESRIGADKHHDDLLRVRGLIFRARDYVDDRYRLTTRRGLMPRAYMVKLAKMRARELDELLRTLIESGEVAQGGATKASHDHDGTVYWPVAGVAEARP